jgi:hypothetical protein
MLILEPSEIKSRADAIGVPLGHLAGDCGVAVSTAYRGANGETGTNIRTAQALTEALFARERALLGRLLTLHPDFLQHREAAE